MLEHAVANKASHCVLKCIGAWIVLERVEMLEHAVAIKVSSLSLEMHRDLRADEFL